MIKAQSPNLPIVFCGYPLNLKIRLEFPRRAIAPHDQNILFRRIPCEWRQENRERGVYGSIKPVRKRGQEEEMAGRREAHIIV